MLKSSDLHQLYQRLGGEAGLEKILKAFYHRMADDILIGYFFAGKDLEHIALQQKQFLMKAMGATRSYGGKAPAQAHTQLPMILTGHFDRRLRILEDVLRGFNVSEQDIQTWVNFENAFRDKLVTHG
jgi:truncated hemoglobin YjbI